MSCKLKISYCDKEIVLEDKVNIDFRFLQEKFGLCLTKDKSRNPVVLTISFINNKEIWVKKTSFTTTVHVKFTEQETWKSLLVSDTFELDDQAFLRIDKFEIKIEKLSTKHAVDVSSKATSAMSTQVNQCDKKSIDIASESTSNNTPENKNFTDKKEQNHMLSEESDDLWNYIDTLLSDDRIRSESAKKEQMQLSPQKNQQEEQNHRHKVINSKASPKKQDLVETSSLKRGLNVCDPNLDDENEIFMTRKKVKTNEISQDFKLLKPSVEQRSFSPMAIENGCIKMSDIDLKSDFSQRNVSQNPPSLSRSEFVKSLVSSRQNQSGQLIEEITDIKDTYNYNSQEQSDFKNNLIDLSLSQIPPQEAEKQNNPKEDIESMKLHRLKQIIDDKRIENAKNSVKKSSVKKLVISPEEKENKENCSICLNDGIEEVGKINCCTHIFCFGCIKDWSNITNECPLCKLRFSEIVKCLNDGSNLETIKVSFKKQVYEEEYIDENEEVDENCYECGNNNDEYLLLVCDSCSFYCCHTYCCNPPLDHIPLGDWNCKFCERDLRLNQRQPSGRRANTNRENRPLNQRASSRRVTRSSTRRGQSLLQDFFEGSNNGQRRSNRFDLEDESSRSSSNSNTSNSSRRNNTRSNNTTNFRTDDSTHFGNSSRYSLRNHGRVQS